VPRKGCKYLLEAVREVVHGYENIPEFRVLICGKGPLDSELKAYVRTQGLQDIVQFAGFVSESDKADYYASADLAVFPSTGGESFGIVLIEAMASGRAAVLAGNNDGYSAVFADHPEVLFDPHDVKTLSSLLAEYVQDVGLRAGTAAWQKEYAEQFDIDTVGRQIVAIYNQALLKRKNMR
jgi:phosphatidylinositol alpha-mannosyltransferase